MTNLEILIEFLGLEGVLDNFDHQAGSLFTILEENYKVFSLGDLKDMVYDKEEEFFEDMLCFLEESSYYEIAGCLDNKEYIHKKLDLFSPSDYDFTGLEYLGESCGNYIYNVY